MAYNSSSGASKIVVPILTPLYYLRHITVEHKMLFSSILFKIFLYMIHIYTWAYGLVYTGTA